MRCCHVNETHVVQLDWTNQNISLRKLNINKQLLNEVEHDIENYQGRGLCYPPKPKAEVDNTNRGLDNSRYYAKAESNNCFIMYSKPRSKEQPKWNR